ncbi:hypothetical protein, partial [Loktanella sp. S4079]|uniref:hypothetical protein n=1 Tax=Loktanella sp. S4079 TaxID=579483 RepID=UPI0012EEC4F9
MYREEYQLNVRSALLDMKASHTTPQESQRDWARQRDERTLIEYRDACQKAGMDTKACDHEIWAGEREQLIADEEVFRVNYEKDRKRCIRP